MLAPFRCSKSLALLPLLGTLLSAHAVEGQSSMPLLRLQRSKAYLYI
jgi:hypothetical protein